MDQAARELLYNVHLARKEFLEVEIFARFLEVCSVRKWGFGVGWGGGGWVWWWECGRM